MSDPVSMSDIERYVPKKNDFSFDPTTQEIIRAYFRDSSRAEGLGLRVVLNDGYVWVIQGTIGNDQFCLRFERAGRGHSGPPAIHVLCLNDKRLEVYGDRRLRYFRHSGIKRPDLIERFVRFSQVTGAEPDVAAFVMAERPNGANRLSSFSPERPAYFVSATCRLPVTQVFSTFNDWLTDVLLPHLSASAAS